MPKRRITAAQKAASKRNLEIARHKKHAENKAKLAFTRAKALDTLFNEPARAKELAKSPGSIKNASVAKAYSAWATFHYISIGVKPVGKRRRHLSKAMAVKAINGAKVKS